jgi:hypothetical protein
MKRTRSVSTQPHQSIRSRRRPRLISSLTWWGDNALVDDTARLIVDQLDTITLIRFSMTSKENLARARPRPTAVERTRLIFGYHNEKLIIRNYPNPAVNVFTTAVNYGTIANIKWAHSQIRDSPYERSVVLHAVARKHATFEVLTWLLEIGCFRDWLAYAHPMKEKDFATMNWLFENKFPLNSDLMRRALLDENLRAFIWLVEHHCPSPVSCFHRVRFTDAMETWINDNRALCITNGYLCM